MILVVSALKVLLLLPLLLLLLLLLLAVSPLELLHPLASYHRHSLACSQVQTLVLQHAHSLRHRVRCLHSQIAPVLFVLSRAVLQLRLSFLLRVHHCSQGGDGDGDGGCGCGACCSSQQVLPLLKRQRCNCCCCCCHSPCGGACCCCWWW